MGTKKNFGIVLFMYTIFICLLSISPGLLASSNSDDEVVSRVFRLTGAEITGLQVNGWRKLNESEIALDSAASYLQDRLQKLAGHGFNGTVKQEYDGQNPAVECEGTIAPGIRFRVVLKEAPGYSKAAKQSMYLTASILSENSSYTLSDLSKYLLLLTPEQDLHRSVVISGSLPGQISPRVVNDFVSRMAVLTQAQNVEIMETSGLVSITGYTPYVRQRLTSDGKSVNINIAFRYNSVENRTFLYVGSPIITNEY